MPSLLLVSASFAPSRLIGGRRAERLAACLTEAGWQVTVLTTHPMYAPPTDPKLLPPPGVEVVRAQAVMPRAWLRALRTSAERLRKREQPARGSGDQPLPPTAQPRMRRLLDWSLAALEFPDEYAGWRPVAEAAMRGRRFDVVLGTMPPFTDAVIAGSLARRMRARLVLDFRDPWTEAIQDAPGIDEATCARHRRMEDALLTAADLVVGVSPTHCAWLSARTGTEVILARNGYDPADEVQQPQVLAARPLHLVYAGSLAYGRDLRPVFAAMASLRPRLGATDLRLTYAGDSGAAVRAWAEAAQVADAIDDLGEVGVAQARQLVDSANLCVVRVSEAYGHAIPAKLYDIAARRRPVLLVGPANCDAAQLVRELALGWACASDDVPGIAAALAAAAAGEWPAAGDPSRLRVDASLSPLLDRLAQFGAQCATEQVRYSRSPLPPR